MAQTHSKGLLCNRLDKLQWPESSKLVIKTDDRSSGWPIESLIWDESTLLKVRAVGTLVYVTFFATHGQKHSDLY